jgi:low affinity Fe/Cu permease
MQIARHLAGRLRFTSTATADAAEGSALGNFAHHMALNRQHFPGNIMSDTTSRSHAKNGHANGSHANGSHAVKSGAKSNGAASHKKPSWFTLFAQKTAQLAGRPFTFMVAMLVIIVWGVSGPVFNYSDTWQLVINTGTTIITFLMVFLIQHTQNRDSLAFQVKLDELIIKLHGAGNELAGAEDLCDEDLEALHETYRKRASQAHEVMENRRTSR